MMANVGFNATHQQIVFTVTRRFYELIPRARKSKLPRKFGARSAKPCTIAQARFDNGLGTKPEVLQAEQNMAQADSILRRPWHAERRQSRKPARILPRPKAAGRRCFREPLSEYSAETLEDLIQRALSQRPDLVAKLANIRARRAEVRKAHAAYYPRSLSTLMRDGRTGCHARNSPYFRRQRTVYGAGTLIELPLFDGFARRKKLRIAESELRGAEDEMAHFRGRLSGLEEKVSKLQGSGRKSQNQSFDLFARRASSDSAMRAFCAGRNRRRAATR